VAASPHSRQGTANARTPARLRGSTAAAALVQERIIRQTNHPPPRHCHPHHLHCLRGRSSSAHGARCRRRRPMVQRFRRPSLAPSWLSDRRRCWIQCIRERLISSGSPTSWNLASSGGLPFPSVPHAKIDGAVGGLSTGRRGEQPHQIGEAWRCGLPSARRRRRPHSSRAVRLEQQHNVSSFKQQRGENGSTTQQSRAAP
jgi:hypothetical protein